MSFSAKQTSALRRNLDHRFVRTREINGRELSYIEGWYAIMEANRIFGFDGWNRETIESRCVITRENRGTFLAVYVARVRITVHTDGSTTIREGHGTGEGRGTSPGEVHDIALKAAETDATKRALSTFGKPFGLALYGKGKTPTVAKAPTSEAQPADLSGQHRFARDDTTPIPRPSRYYGRRQDPVSRDLASRTRIENDQHDPGPLPTADTSIVPPPPELLPGRIDKSALAIGEPKRQRDKAHLRFVASQPCLICRRQPCDPHHLRFAQPRALGLEAAINEDYRPRTNFELELIARLVSLLWRLRRAVAIESGLLDIQARILRKRSAANSKRPDKNTLSPFYALIPTLAPRVQVDVDQQSAEASKVADLINSEDLAKPNFFNSDIARSFTRISNFDSDVFDRLDRYEMRLWRQSVQIILLLNSINRGAHDGRDDCDEKYFYLRNSPRNRRRALWPPFVTSG